MIIIYTTRATSKSFRDMKRYLKDNKVPFEVKDIYKDPSLFWWNDYRRLMDGLAFNSGHIHPTAKNMVSRITPDSIPDYLDTLTDIEAVAFLRDNLQYLKSCFTYDTVREVAVSGFDADEASVFLKKSTKRRHRKELMKKVAKLSKESHDIIEGEEER